MAGGEPDGKGLRWTRWAVRSTLTLHLAFVASALATLALLALDGVAARFMQGETGTAVVTAVNALCSPICCLSLLVMASFPLVSVPMLLSIREMKEGRAVATLGALAWPASVVLAVIGFLVMSAGTVGFSMMIDEGGLADAVLVASYLAAGVFIFGAFVLPQVGLTLYLWRVSSTASKALMVAMDLIQCAFCVLTTVLSVIFVALAIVFIALLVEAREVSDTDPWAFFAFIIIIILVVMLLAAMLMVLYLSQIFGSVLQASKAFLATRWLGRNPGSGES